MNRKLMAIVLMMVMGIMVLTLNANAQLFGKNTNLLKNGGFEAVENNFPKDWRFRDDPPPPNIKAEISQDNPHSGKHCLLINNIDPGDCAVIQNVTLESEKVYLISCWIRTENVAHPEGSANLTLVYLDAQGGIEGILTSQEFADTGNQWVKLEFPFRAIKTENPLLVGVRLGGQGVANQGKAYFDDLEVKEVSNRDDAIGFFMPAQANNPPEEPQDQPQDQTPPPGPPIPTKTLLFVIIGTLVVGFLVFLEFNLSKKEKREQAAAEKTDSEKMDPTNEIGQSEPAVNGQITDNVTDKSSKTVNGQITD